MSPHERAALLAQGRAAALRGEPFVAHEHWEDVWRECEDPLRRWVQGLVQLVAALHHLGRARRDPAARLLARGLDKLADAPELLEGIDLAAARADARRILDALARGEIVDGVTLRC